MAAEQAELSEQVEALNWTSRIWRYAGEIQKAGRIAAQRTDNQLDYGTRAPGGRRPSFSMSETSPEIKIPYDPDTFDQAFWKPASEFSGLYNVCVRRGAEWAQPVVPHRLQVVQMVREGMRWKRELTEVRIDDGKMLKGLESMQAYRKSRYLEATGEWATGRLEDHVWQKNIREALDTFGFGGDSDMGASGVMRDIDQEFVPIMGGPYHRQLYLYAHWEQLAKAFEVKNHSELARAAIQITSDFTLGRGVAWKITNDRVRRVWEEFWRRNRMDEKFRTWCDDLTWQGELLVRKDFPLRGFMRVRSIDPSVCLEIVTEPTDIEQVYYYHCQFPTQYQLPYLTFRGQRMDVPLMRYVVEQLPPNEVYHVKHNVSSSEKRGRSDFFVSLGTLKRHRDWTNAATLKDMLQSNLIWKIKLKGDDTDTSAFAEDPNNLTLPAFGGTWIENDALELLPIHQDVERARSGGGGGGTGQFLTALFATGQGMPLAYFNVQGGSGGAARAAALQQGEPFAKKVLGRQQSCKRLLDHLFEEEMKAAVQAGRLKPSDIRGDDADPEWLFPATYEEDRGAKFTDLTTAKGMAAISQRTMAVQMAKELQLDSYDYDQERKLIDEETQDQFLALWPPVAGGTSAVQAPSLPAAPVPAVGQPQLPAAGMGEEQQGPMLPGVPAKPLGQPAPNANLHQRIAGAETRAQFRRDSGNRASESGLRLTHGDRRFLEAAIKSGVAGDLRLPSGLVARIPS